MTDIFLSYSSKDREKVRPIRDALVAFGYDVFWDVETPAGENWDQWIRLHIAKAKVVVVFWTKNSAASVNVQHEAAIAREDNKLIPAQLELMRAIDFPMGFYTTQAPQLSDWDEKATHAGYASLMKAVRRRFDGTLEQIAQVIREEKEGELQALTRKADAGDAGSLVELGYRYYAGQGVPKDGQLAVHYFQRAAEKGDIRAKYNIGKVYAEGCVGVTRNDEEAARHYRVAAELGNDRAQTNLALMYMEGRAGLSPEDSEAERLLRLAAAQKNAVAYRALADLAERRGEDAGEFIRLLSLAADGGDADAQSLLGIRYATGNGVAKNEAEALRLFKLSADQGLGLGLCNLALMYEQGLGGLVPDRNKAIELFRLAAKGDLQFALDALKRLGVSP